jgi:hypothetical protein
MVGPIDGVLAIHNAFRADMAAIDAAAADAARGTPDLDATVERFVFFNETTTPGTYSGRFRKDRGPLSGGRSTPLQGHGAPVRRGCETC